MIFYMYLMGKSQEETPWDHVCWGTLKRPQSLGVWWLVLWLVSTYFILVLSNVNYWLRIWCIGSTPWPPCTRTRSLLSHVSLVIVRPLFVRFKGFFDISFRDKRNQGLFFTTRHPPSCRASVFHIHNSFLLRVY